MKNRVCSFFYVNIVNHKGSGMASFGQGTAVHYTDPVYDIQISVIHFLPFIRGVLGVLADG